jgi:nucleotide-binding universal stress UspA family protein
MSTIIQKILFPVDFSTASVAMAVYLKRAAAIFAAEVTIVHVCDLDSHNGFELYARPVTDIAREHWNLAGNKLQRFLTSEFPAAKSPRVLLAGDPAAAIVDHATTNKFDLIVMPTHAGRLRRLMLGSTTARVLGAAACPVLTTQHAETAAPRSLEHRKWVCASGLGANSERVLSYASRLSLATAATLSLVHAVEASEPESEVPSRQEYLARQRIAELQSRSGSAAAVRIAVGPVKETLLNAVVEEGADVLVIGRSRHNASGRLDDLTYSLVRDSPCPVVSV